MAAPYDATADLYCCSLDPSGAYTLKFSTDSARDTLFSGSTSDIHSQKISANDFVYIRKDQILKVNYNADYLDSLGINYCRYKNSTSVNPNTKYIYAFVTEIEYLAPTVSALHLSTDSFMTYQNKIEASEEFILRRTLDGTEDIIYHNLVPEDVTGENYKLSALITGREQIQNKADFIGKYFIGIIFRPLVVDRHDSWLTEAADPNKAEKTMINNICGHYMNGFPCGGNIMIVKDLAHFDQVNEMISALGSIIIATFWIPSSGAVSIGTERHIVYTIEDVTGTDTRDCYFYTPDDDTWLLAGYTLNGTMSNSFDSYTPINKKCYNYPYNYMIASDNAGAEITYRFEHFYTNAVPSGAVTFSGKFVTSTQNAIVVMPDGYMDTDTALDYAIIAEGFPQIPYTSDSYAYYLGTHAAQTAVSKYGRYLDYGKGIFEIGKEAIEAKAGGRGLSMSTVASGFGQIADTFLNETVPAYTGAGDLQQQLGYDTHNAASVSTRATLGYLGVTIYHKYLCDHDIQRIDEYFSRYGYAWGMIETLKLKNCPDYDYIKTSSCNITGTIPTADKQKLNALFDSGITIWHKSSRYGKFADSANPNK